MKARGRPQPENPAAVVMSRREGLKLLTEINKATLKAQDFTTYRALRDRVLDMRNATLPALERVLDAQEVDITQKFERDTLYVRVGSANKQKVDVVENAFKDFAVKHSYRTVLVEVCVCVCVSVCVCVALGVDRARAGTLLYANRRVRAQRSGRCSVPPRCVALSPVRPVRWLRRAYAQRLSRGGHSRVSQLFAVH
jgi:hypothetical protein